MKVLKIGGSILEKFLEDDNLHSVIEQFDGELSIVHGGGNYLDNHAENFNYTKKFVTSPEGIRSRYTDRNTLDSSSPDPEPEDPTFASTLIISLERSRDRNGAIL